MAPGDDLSLLTFRLRSASYSRLAGGPPFARMSIMKAAGVTGAMNRY